MPSKLQSHDALLLVDPQLDFFPGGALPVPEGDKIIPVLNRWLAAAQQAGIPIIVSRDWHPADHISFQAQGGPWPQHCVRHTQGVQFHPALQLPATAIVVNKAFETHQESYSAFAGVAQADGMGLPEKLQQLGVQRLWVGGLALDYCVVNTVMDARTFKFAVNLILPACRAISEKTGQAALEKMRQAGVIVKQQASPEYSS